MRNKPPAGTTRKSRLHWNKRGRGSDVNKGEQMAAQGPSGTPLFPLEPVEPRISSKGSILTPWLPLEHISTHS